MWETLFFIFAICEPLTLSVSGLMSTFNVGSCEQRHRIVHTHLNDNSSQLQQPIVFILLD